MILLVTLAVGVVYGNIRTFGCAAAVARFVCERRPFKGGVSALPSQVVGWADLPHAEASTTLSKCEGPHDVPNVEAENAGVAENALESRMWSCAPCALPDSPLWRSAGGHRGVVRVALSPSERLLAVVPGWEQYLRASNLGPRHGPRAHHLRGRARRRRVRPLLARVRAQRCSPCGDQLRWRGGAARRADRRCRLRLHPGAASRAHPPAPPTSTRYGDGRVR